MVRAFRESLIELMARYEELWLPGFGYWEVVTYFGDDDAPKFNCVRFKPDKALLAKLEDDRLDKMLANAMYHSRVGPFPPGRQ